MITAGALVDPSRKGMPPRYTSETFPGSSKNIQRNMESVNTTGISNEIMSKINELQACHNAIQDRIQILKKAANSEVSATGPAHLALQAAEKQLIDLRSELKVARDAVKPAPRLQPYTEKWVALTRAAGQETKKVKQVREAFWKVWFDQKPLTPQETSLLQMIFEQYPLEATDFDTWLNKTVRDLFEKHAQEIHPNK